MVLMMEPLTILGALVGSFLNRVLPEFILILLLAVVLAATASRTVKKGFKLWAKESKENREKREQRQLLSHSGAAAGQKQQQRRLLSNKEARAANEDDEDEDDEEEEGGGGSKNSKHSFSLRVGDRVRVRDDPKKEQWKRGVVTTAPDPKTGRVRVRKVRALRSRHSLHLQSHCSLAPSS